MTRARRRLARQWVCWLGIFLLLGLSGCTLDGVAARQEKSSAYWPELLAGQSYGQTFVSESANLYRVDVATATFGRDNTCTVLFHLRSDPSAAQDLAVVSLPCAAVQNDRPTVITFPRIADSQGKTYYFFLESPDASAGNAVSLLVDENDGYAFGTAYQNQQAVEADVAFTAYSQQEYTLAGVVNSFLQRAGLDPVFAVGYLLVLVLLLILWVRFRRA